MAENKKFFLDFSGLQALWAKMKTTFASKAEVTNVSNTINTVSGAVSTLQTAVESINNELDTVERNFNAITPPSVGSYSEALTAASSLVPGTIVRVTEGDETYKSGFYIVEGPGSVKYLGTSEAGDKSDIDLLTERLGSLEGSAIKSAVIQDAQGHELSVVQTSGNKMYIVYDNTFVIDSQSTNALTHKAAAAMYGDIMGKINALPKFSIEVVDELPASDIKLDRVYLVKNATEQSNNLYTEYIYANGAWEKLGEQTIDLANYVTNEALTSALNAATAALATKAELAAAKTEILNSVAGTYASKTELASYATKTELENATGRITEAEIESLS